MKRIINEHSGTFFTSTDKLPISFIQELRMGTTVATNTLLEHKGERTLLLVSKGFKDLLVIGNQARPDIFDLSIKNHRKHNIWKHVVEVDESVRPFTKYDENDLSLNIVEENGVKIIIEEKLNLINTFPENLDEIMQNIDSVAICLKHSVL